jgi:hypothetical protein
MTTVIYFFLFYFVPLELIKYKSFNYFDDSFINSFEISQSEGWHLFNDSNCSPVSASDVQSRDGRAGAYLLFYIRDQALPDYQALSVSEQPLGPQSESTLSSSSRPPLVCRRIKFLRILLSETVKKIVNKIGVRNNKVFDITNNKTVSALVFSTWDPRPRACFDLNFSL